jgi:hypothetical protein
MEKSLEYQEGYIVGQACYRYLLKPINYLERSRVWRQGCEDGYDAAHLMRMNAEEQFSLPTRKVKPVLKEAENDQ